MLFPVPVSLVGLGVARKCPSSASTLGQLLAELRAMAVALVP